MPNYTWVDLLLFQSWKNYCIEFCISVINNIMLILKSEKYCKFIISSLFWLYNDNVWDYTDIVRISNHFLCTLHAWICSIFTILFVIFINWRILLSHTYLWFLNDFVWFYNPFHVVFNVWNKYKNKFTEIFLHFY